MNTLLVKLFIIDRTLFFTQMEKANIRTIRELAKEADLCHITIHKALSEKKPHGIHQNTALKLAKALLIDKDHELGRELFYKIFSVERTPSKTKA